MENMVKTQKEIENEMMELNEQFTAFLKTKGIASKFKLAFNNMSDSAKKQRECDIKEFEAEKTRSAEDNKEFAEFLRTKGIKAKYKLVVENIKKGAKMAPHDTASKIAQIKYQTQEAVNKANALGGMYSEISAITLEEEFNAFLKAKGLDGKYAVSVTEE